MTSKEYKALLSDLAELLRARPRTAKEIATEMRCCKPAAYERLQALKASGVAIYELRARRKGATGPAPVIYGIRKG